MTGPAGRPAPDDLEERTDELVQMSLRAAAEAEQQTNELSETIAEMRSRLGRGEW